MTPNPWSNSTQLARPTQSADTLAAEIREWARENRRRGAVIGVSGGIDSAVTLGLAARALGAGRVVGMALPEHDSDPASARLAAEAADVFGVELIVRNITPVLEAWDAYGMRDEAAREVFPDYDPAVEGVRAEYLARLDDPGALATFCLTRVKADGTAETKILPPRPYLQIVAATNLKQRARMTALYFEAESRNFGVVGTSNKLEIEQGFFVKHGDGAGDLFPLARYFKGQVYDLARVLGVPMEIINRVPTTDTYSAPQTQEEFYYGLPAKETDVMWAAFEAHAPAAAVGDVVGLSDAAAQKVYDGFARRQVLARYLRANPIAENGAARGGESHG